MHVLVTVRRPLVRKALADVLTTAHPEWSFTFSEHREEARRRIDVGDIDLAILSSDALGAGATGWIRELRAAHPRVKLIVLAADARRHSPFAYISAGVQSYLDENLPIDQILYAIHSILAGTIHIVISAENDLCFRTGNPNHEQNSGAGEESVAVAVLTPRQVDVIQLLAAGSSVKEIARHLNLGIGTVKSHLSLAYSALGARNRVDAVIRAGLVRPNDAPARPDESAD
jgi:DNA-binding NarL/FixJ family response regulator